MTWRSTPNQGRRCTPASSRAPTSQPADGEMRSEIGTVVEDDGGDDTLVGGVDRTRPRDTTGSCVEVTGPLCTSTA